MKRIIGAIIFGALFVGEIALLRTYDVAAIGPEGNEVGLSHINQKVHQLTGVNMLWYDITEYIGVAAIAVCLIFALAGLIQLIRRRSLLKVDREILALGGLFAVTIGFYVLFEKFVVNCRPVILPTENMPEPSFPSSHTVLALVVMISVMMIIDRYANNLFAGFIRAICVMVAAVAVAGRLYSGVHWFTDIIGGILLSAALLFAFAAVIKGGSPELQISTDNSGAAVPVDKNYVPKH